MLEQLTSLNETVLACLTESDEKKIIKDFTDIGIKILEANFGYAWVYSSITDSFELAYKTPNLPYIPKPPKKEGKNIEVLKSGKPYFVTKVYKRKDKHDLSKHMKAFVILPIHFAGETFGNIVICFEEKELFPQEKRILAISLGQSVAQSIIINRLIQSEKAAASLAEKQKATEALLAQEKSKTEFIANATHELRTPLAIMQGNIDLALMNKDNLKSTVAILRKVNKEITILSNLMKDMALLTSGSPLPNVTYIMNPAKIEIVKLIKKISTRLITIAARKNIDLKTKIANEKKIFVSGDEKYLEELFINLIKNAISYGKKGGNVKINIEAEKETVKIKIVDNGAGISKEDLPKIFERFYRGNKAHTDDSEEKHSGLGLAIAKVAAEIHNGKIEVESVLGKGSAFTVVLPRLLDI